MTASPTVLFPEPDSPTKPKISPAVTANDTPRTAFTAAPRGLWYVTCRSRTSRSMILLRAKARLDTVSEQVRAHNRARDRKCRQQRKPRRLVQKRQGFVDHEPPVGAGGRGAEPEKAE